MVHPLHPAAQDTTVKVAKKNARTFVQTFFEKTDWQEPESAGVELDDELLVDERFDVGALRDA